jgi:hypothetical protein
MKYQTGSIASQRRAAMPTTPAGPSDGASLARIVGPIRTRDLMLTGRTLTASEAAVGFGAFREGRYPNWVYPDLRVDGRL